MIKLDIINEVVNKTGITKTKAEMAVETVFESMKRDRAFRLTPYDRQEADARVACSLRSGSNAEG